MIARTPFPRGRHSTLMLCLLALSSALIGMFTTVFAAPLVVIMSASPTTINAAPLGIPTPQQLFSNPILATPCTLINDEETYAFIRTAPRDDYAVIGLIPPRGMIDAIGITSNGWYAVNYAERLAWISAVVMTIDAATASGCARMPTLTNPTIPEAPSDARVHVVNVDRDGERRFINALSTPGGDTRDLVVVSVINLFSEPPNNYREMVIVLTCTGDGNERVRWGAPTNPTRGCGDAITLPFLINANRQTFIVMLPNDAPQSYIEYELQVLQAVG